MKYGVLVMVKEDYEYIIPFINHYFKLGFHKIFMIDDNTQPPLIDYINKNNNLINESINIEYIRVDFNNNDFYNETSNFKNSHLYNEKLYKMSSELKQHYLTNIVYSGIKHKVDWLFHCDIDEFIYLRDHTNIKDFIESLLLKNSTLNGIYLRWINYGTSYHNKYPSEGHIFENFIHHDDKFAFHGKTIFKTENVNMIDLHVPLFVNNVYSLNNNDDLENMETIIYLPYRNGLAYIAHYYTLDSSTYIKRKILRHNAMDQDISYKKIYSQSNSIVNFNKISDLTMLKYVNKYNNADKLKIEQLLIENKINNYNKQHNTECETLLDMCIHSYETKTDIY